jgi:hypothetical protein
MKRVAIVQSNYIPWKGYFDLINLVDEFVIYDDAQYTKRDWRNRNLIITKDGPKWITIPVEVKNRYTQTIKETKISNNNWVDKHLKKLHHSYSRAKYYCEEIDWIEKIFRECEHELFLSQINLYLIREILGFLGIKTKISSSSDYIIKGAKSEKILNICQQADATEYLSGPAAKSYLDLESFEKAGINVKWMNYSGYRKYPQQYISFIHEVSIIDVIFNTGPNSRNYLNSTFAS